MSSPNLFLGASCHLNCSVCSFQARNYLICLKASSPEPAPSTCFPALYFKNPAMNSSCDSFSFSPMQAMAGAAGLEMASALEGINLQLKKQNKTKQDLICPERNSRGKCSRWAWFCWVTGLGRIFFKCVDTWFFHGRRNKAI